MSEGHLIGGEELKAAVVTYMAQLQVRTRAGEPPGIFDKWFARVAAKLLSLDGSKSWEQSIAEEIGRLPPAQARSLEWDFLRLRLFLDRWLQGRFVPYNHRRESSVHYVPKYGTEFGSDVLLTCQGVPSFMQWRGKLLMKTVFDFALYPQLIAELKPRTIFEIGSGSGASAIWYADLLKTFGIEGYVHSVDIVPVKEPFEGVSFYQGDCGNPASLFDTELLKQAAHPWLVVEDAHHNVEAVLQYMHGHMKQGDYLVVEDSEIKQNDLRRFIDDRPGCYQVDTKFTDFFGRNATCALDSIFARIS